MIECDRNGHIPLVYLHPYDLTLEHNFWVNWNSLYPANLIKKILFWTRQFQWSHLGHKSVEYKLSKITEVFEHQGPMRNLIYR